ncbi:siphovirus ReqiPepy6 Gp37-like family protein [Sporosarcina sp. Te-1]|uniref:siphovirus ReqiPepy6 Gp37-like family protein n=1 Tax=Sporosarcina sp. Te-1 TaxID=2818390 RepID=UPI001A9D4C58|nr:siphovirus ReqiPepy6 Gp37-like family protein [Sporosarcina sp. Te-1]QTD41541.1 siphovirus ReqiPepy6 Gp37-like family protein [Sporosarcina sp. Te-1]
MNKPIRILTPDIEILGEISNYESLIFTRSWYGIGTLELRINRHKNYTETLQKGNIIIIGQETHKVFQILHREIELDQQGKVTENWHITAHELKTIVGRRLTIPPANASYDNKSGAVESVIKHYVERNLINPLDPRRKIPQLLVAPDLQRGPYIERQSRFKNLAEEIAELSLLSDVGWGIHVDYDLQKWVFDIDIGKDISVNQDVNPPVIFSPQFGNIKDMHFVDSDLNYRNVALVAGEGEGFGRRVLEVGLSTGLERYEVFVDARDVPEETDEEDSMRRPRPDIDVIRDLENRGYQSLAEMGQEMYLEGQIMTAGSFTYELDWDLGDITTIQNQDWGVTLDSRITEVTEVYEREGMKLSITLGQSRPTLMSKIKQELAGIQNEIVK